MHTIRKAGSVNLFRLNPEQTVIKVTSDPFQGRDLIYRILNTTRSWERSRRRAARNIEPPAWTGTITEDEIKLALGERCDIWPEGIREMAEEEED